MGKIRSRKLLTALAIITLSALVISGCGNNRNESSGESGEGNKNIELSFVTWSYGVETIADNIKKFSDMYPYIQVKHSDYSWLDYHDTIVSRFVANNFPDLLYGSDHWLYEWASAGWLVPLDDHFPKVKEYAKELTKYSIEGMTNNGKIYGLPYYADTIDFVYNDQHLKDAGFDKPPETWEEVYDMATALKNKGIVQYPIVLAWSQKEGAFPETFQSMVFGRHDGDGAFFDKDLNPIFNKEGTDVYNTLEWIRKAYKDGLIDPASLTMTELDQVKSMQSGAHTFTVLPQYNLAELNKPGSGEFAGKFKIGLMPGKSHSTVGFVRFYAMTSGLEKKGKEALDAAWKFLEYSAGKTDGEYKVVERWAVENGLGFAQLPLYDNQKVREAFGKWGDIEIIRKQAQLARAKEGMTTWYGTWDVFARAEIHKAILDQQSTMNTLNNLANKWNELKSQSK